MKMQNIINSTEFLKMYESGRKDFHNSKFYGVDFSGKILKNINFSGSSFDWCTFRGSNLTSSSFENCSIVFCVFAGANLSGVNFEKSKIEYCLFEDSYFQNTSFKKSVIRVSVFVGANLGGADFTDSTQVRFITSWVDVREEDIGFAMGELAKRNVSFNLKLGAKKLAQEARSKSEGVKLFYDFGRKTLSSSERPYNVETKSKGSAVYIPWGGIYIQDLKYKPSKRENVYKK